MRHAFSIVFWTFLAVSCIPLFCVAVLVWLLTLPFDPNGRVLHLYSCAWAQLYFWLNPLWKLRFEGRDKLPTDSAAVLVANHESLGDILVLFGLFKPYKWVSKKSVFKVPFIGWNMRLNRYVSLVRGDKPSIQQMMRECEGWIDRGVPVLLFPEGTRSTDGQMRPFKDGAFILAKKKSCPVIPLVLTGTGQTLPKHGFIFQKHADCVVRVLDPVLPDEFDSVEALREHVRDLMVADHRARSEATTPVAAEVETVGPGERRGPRVGRAA